MPQWARYAVPIALVLLAGCVTESEMARRRLQGARMLTLGSWMPVQRADFAKGDPLKARPSTPGSQALHDAMIADESVAAFVREHGVPNAIAIVSGYAQSVDLAYVDRRTAYSLRDGEAVPGERALIDAELNLIDPDRLLASQAEALQHNIDAMARVITVGRRVLLAMPAPPAGSPPGEFYGGLWPRTSAISAHLLGHAPDADGRVVAWVHPEGPGAGQLRPGDCITAINGMPVATFDSSGKEWSGPMTLTVERGGEGRDVTVQPEAWPRQVIFVAVVDDTPNAGAVDHGVAVTTSLLDLVPSDDALAWIIGHELAHIALGHTEHAVTAGTVLKGIVTVGVLLPAQIVVPGSGQLLGGLMRGVENRFNRDQERDADRLGIQYMRAAGYDPMAAYIVLDTLEAKVPVGSVTQFFDVHPPYPERRELVAAEIDAKRQP
jgi:Peptidase family M48/PDZ domain